MHVDREGFIALRRYFLWTTEMRGRFYGALGEARTRGVEPFELGRRHALSAGDSFQYMSYWCAALVVVIEGWEELRLRNPEIDLLLANDANRDLLRRYRNGVYHFQRRLDDDRFFDLIREGEAVVPWVIELTAAFGRVLFPDAQPPSS